VSDVAVGTRAYGISGISSWEPKHFLIHMPFAAYHRSTLVKKERKEKKKIRSKKSSESGSPALLVEKLLFLDTGTAVTLLLTRNTDLFCAVAGFCRARRFSGSGVRRVLTFPSGLLLVGEVDVKLLVGLGVCLRFGVPVGRWEDAEGDRDASFKVQIDDFCEHKRIFSYNLP
jgi:hypothetical protein